MRATPKTHSRCLEKTRSYMNLPATAPVNGFHRGLKVWIALYETDAWTASAIISTRLSTHIAAVTGPHAQQKTRSRPVGPHRLEFVTLVRGWHWCRRNASVPGRKWSASPCSSVFRGILPHRMQGIAGMPPSPFSPQALLARETHCSNGWVWMRKGLSNKETESASFGNTLSFRGTQPIALPLIGGGGVCGRQVSTGN